MKAGNMHVHTNTLKHAFLLLSLPLIPLSLSLSFSNNVSFFPALKGHRRMCIVCLDLCSLIMKLPALPTRKMASPIRFIKSAC